MATVQEINYRSTSGFVSGDSADAHIETSGGNNYPTVSAQGVNVGWTSGASSIDKRNVTSTIDSRLAGIAASNSGTAACNYRIDLTGLGGPGTYRIRVAMGDDDNARPNQKLEVFDDAASLGVLINGAAANHRWLDATGVELTATTWPTTNAYVDLDFTSNTANFLFGNGTNNWAVSHIRIERVGGSGSTYDVSASDAATATDAATQQLAAPAAATDAATATDSASNLGVLTRSASDAAAATDAATVTLTMPASASDAATATDASTSASAVNSAATDAVAASDAATQLAVLPAAASDAAAVTDSATNLGVLTRSATDAAAASDAATGLRVTLGSASDAAAATDTAAQVSAANVAATDAISASDAATVQAVLVGIVSDGFSAIDAATLLAGIYNVAAVDVLSLLDVALADGGVTYARAPSGMGSPLIYPGTERPAVISGSRTGNINTARPANRGGRRS